MNPKKVKSLHTAVGENNVVINGNVSGSNIVTGKENVIPQSNPSTIFSQISFTYGKNLENILSEPQSIERVIEELLNKEISNLSQNELMSYDIGSKVLFLLALHPKPTDTLNLLLVNRPKADINTLITLLPSWAQFELETKFLKVFGYDIETRFQELQRAFASTKIWEQVKKGSISDERLETVKELFEFFDKHPDLDTLMKYFESHPQIFSLEIDFIIATMCALAYITSDEKQLEIFMKLRDLLSIKREND